MSNQNEDRSKRFVWDGQWLRFDEEPSDELKVVDDRILAQTLGNPFWAYRPGTTDIVLRFDGAQWSGDPELTARAIVLTKAWWDSHPDASPDYDNYRKLFVSVCEALGVTPH